METRANYVLVGILTVVAIVAAFAFIYWTAAIGDRGETTMLRIRIPGSASGLARGSAVLFNGVRVGDVRRVFIDVQNPTVAIADAEIDRLTPITRSTQADIGLAGLTGQASIELKGADPTEENLLDRAEEDGTIAIITANPSTITNLLQTAQDIFKRADTVLGQLEGFTQEVRGPLTETVMNARTFSSALADHASGIDLFLKSVSDLSEELAGVSGKLDGTLKAAEDLLKAVDPAKVETIVGNVETFSNSLGASSERIDTIVKGVDEAIASMNGFAADAGKAIAKVDGMLEGVDVDTVRNALSNIERASTNADKVAADIARVTERIAPDDIDRIIREAGELATRLNQASTRVDGVLAKADEFLTAAGGALEGVDAETVHSAIANIERASSNADKAAADIARITERIGPRGDDIDKLITDAAQMADRLNQASTRVDGILARVDDLLGSGQAEGVISEASETLQAFRKVADTLNARLGTITDGLARFSDQGLREVEALIRDSRRSITRIEQAVSDLERNPQRIITGGQGEVRTYDGRARR